MTRRFFKMYVISFVTGSSCSNSSSLQYKAMYDLVDNAMPAPSRPTRSRRTEQMQLLKTPSISAPIPAPTFSSKSKVKTKTITAVWEQLGTATKSKKATVVPQDQRNGNALTSDSGHEVDTPEDSISVMLARKEDENVAELALAKQRREVRGSISTSNGHIAESAPTASRRSDRLRASVTGSDLPSLGTEASIDHGTSPVSLVLLSIQHLFTNLIRARQ